MSPEVLISPPKFKKTKCWLQKPYTVPQSPPKAPKSRKVPPKYPNINCVQVAIKMPTNRYLTLRSVPFLGSNCSSLGGASSNKTKEPYAVSAVAPTMTTVNETREGAARFQELDNHLSTSGLPFHQGPVAMSHLAACPPDPFYPDKPPPAYESSDDEDNQVIS